MAGFGEFDSTGDGLSISEFIEFIKGNFGISLSEETAKGVFQDIDSRKADNDRITWDEWSEFREANPMDKVKDKDLCNLFKELDSDGSGKVSLSELLEALKCKGYNQEEAKTIFDKIDTNNDNSITSDEWRQVTETLKQSQ